MPQSLYDRQNTNDNDKLCLAAPTIQNLFRHMARYKCLLTYYAATATVKLLIAHIYIFGLFSGRGTTRTQKF